jgi:2-dehydro-3-deoxyphosphogluconate aldolase/(4S)-4-hydroxy-2-oxoglutarate aldolase
LSRSADLERIIEHRIVAVIRSEHSDKLIDAARALSAGGVKIMEVTFTVPKALRVLETVCDALGDEVLLGAGTVLDAETARAAILAGARFLVSPHTNRALIELAHRYDVLVIPGALTPTEVVTAWEAGADIVKIFPSDLGGPQYIKALRAPLPQVRMMPTGGVTLETAAAFLRAGACALGVGSALVEAQAIAAGQWQRLEELARQYVACVRSVATGV